MEHAVNPAGNASPRIWMRWELASRVFAARTLRMLGPAGLLGLALLAAAAWIVWQSQQAVHQPVPPLLDQNRSPSPTPAAIQVPSARPILPARADLQRVLAQVEEAARDSGLAWNRAEYRIHAVDDRGLAHLEVGSTVKGSYASVRGFVARLLERQPALALRNLSMIRPNSDTSEVEAKLEFVVFLADGWPPAIRQPWPVPSAASAVTARASTGAK